MPLPSRKQQTFAYRDYLSWPENYRVELLDGAVFDMSPEPSRRHQQVSGELFKQIAVFLTGKPCEVYSAPFDVRLPDEEEADDEVRTVVQPDILVVCDESKLDERGCRGAPDVVVEVVSPATAARDQIYKVRVYEKAGVREYWIVHPVDNLITVRRLSPSGNYDVPKLIEGKGALEVGVLPGLVIDLDAVFDSP